VQKAGLAQTLNQAEAITDTYAVNDAQVVCGNVQTRNATVYLIDSVLIPSS
jgi:uncharacterized surface protein with fasciclin (FAS1) repeats